ncbi:MAG: heat-inducible transcriptional repressor HrcA [Bacillota bacterium]
MLQAIIEDYIATAEPVGSRTIARKYNLGVSSATIRNEMSDLEELGYIEQPHTSAGRVPSDKGYRLYVDTLIDHPSLDEARAAWIRREYRARVRHTHSLVQLTGRLLAELTSYTSIVLAPQEQARVCRHVDLVPLGSGTAMLVLVTAGGSLESSLVELPAGVGDEELRDIAQLLDQELSGIALGQLARGALRGIELGLNRYQELLRQSLGFLERVPEEGADKVFLCGTKHILGQPEFQDLHKVRPLLALLEQEAIMQDLLTSPGTGLSVTIGGEHKHAEMQDCSLVTATYRVGGRPAGRIALLGPRRMNYVEAMATLNFVTSQLSEVLSKLLGK